MHMFWPASIYVLLVARLVALVISLTWHPPVSKRTPKLIYEGYPILGMRRFVSARSNFYHDGVAASTNGQFSFYYGKHQIVAVSGVEGRKMFFESKGLSMSEGHAPLLPRDPEHAMHRYTGQILPFLPQMVLQGYHYANAE